MDMDKEKIYQSATRQLMRQLDEMNMPRDVRLRAKNFALLFRDSFKLDAVKYATFYPYIGDDYKLFRYDSYGFCRAASFSFTALMPRGQWRIMYIDERWAYGPHFFVRHVATGKNLDLTFDQYTSENITVPYHLGVPVEMNADGPRIVSRFLKSAGVDVGDLFKYVKNKDKR